MGNKINAMYRCVIYLSAPLTLRLKESGNALTKNLKSGCKSAVICITRNKDSCICRRAFHEKTDMWIQKLSCPVIYADDTREIQEHVKWLRSNYAAILGEKAGK